MSRLLYRFDTWLVDPVASSLTNNKAKDNIGQASNADQLQLIDHKVMSLLLYLMQRANQVISRDELLSQLWPNQYVSDDVLNVAISNLRKHLQDSSRQPKYIKTIPRQGYQWLVAVEKIEADIESERSTVQSNTSEVTNSFKKNSSKASRWILALPVLFLLFIYLDFSGFKNEEASNRSGETSGKVESPVTLAVLPFDLFSASDSQQYIVNGITEAIINRLVQEPEFRIISRSSVMNYQTNRPPVPVIAKQLNVDWILEGSVQIDGQQMLVTAQLIEAASDQHIWSHTYQRTMLDIFNVQAEIADQIRRQFSSVASDGSMNTRLVNSGQLNPLAYDALLQAKYFAFKNNTDEAVKSYQLALSLEPDYAEALAGLAQVYFLKAYSDLENAARLIEQASEFAIKAEKINPDSAQVQLNLAIYYWLQENDYANAGEAFARAYALDEQDLMLQEWYLNYLNTTRQFDLALEIADKMKIVSPLSYNKLSRYYVLYYAGKYQEAIKEAESKRAFLANPDYADVLTAWCYIALNDSHNLAQVAPKTLEYLKVTESVKTDFIQSLQQRDIAAAMQGLYEALLPTMGSYEKAEFLAWSGRHDEAIELLETFIATKHIDSKKIAIEPAFLKLQNLPRFQRLLRRLQLN